MLKQVLYGLCRCHTKQEDLAGLWHQPIQAFFWYDTSYRIVFCWFHKLYFIVGVIPKEGLVGLVQPKPSFGITLTMTKMLRMDLTETRAVYL